jgi:nitrile hydratase beta subunit
VTLDGVHDMGGMHGFGALDIEADEPVFHERWEARTFALMIVTAAAELRTGSIRPGIEGIEPGTYLASSYYERWARSVEAGLVDAGTLTTAEIDARAATGEPPSAHVAETNAEHATGLVGALVGPRQASGEAVRSRFAVGDRVTVRRMAPAGHHRCPRYVRGATGTVARVAGGWPHASSDGPAEATYTVRFAMADLWGDDAEAGALYLDLWERYLA